MIKNKIDFNKSNLRIAPPNVSPNIDSPVTIDLSVPLSEINNNSNNNLNNNNNNQNNTGTQPSSPSSHVIVNSNFASSQSSPSLDDTSQMISVATLNVRGFNNSTKFSSVLDDLLDKDLSIIGLTETRLNESSASSMFKAYCATWHNTYPYRAYWDHLPSNKDSERCNGVGIVIKAFVAKYVQKITRFQGRYIAIDIFLPSRKLRIMNIYFHQKQHWFDGSRTHRTGPGKALAEYIKDQILQAELGMIMVQ